MFIYFFVFLIIIVTQIMLMFIWGEHVWLYKFANGGVGGTITDQINPVFWKLLLGEIIIFSLLMILKKNIDFKK
ncbi:MAG: hypothetical protein ABS951_18760 [Solibacillus sp.]